MEEIVYFDNISENDKYKLLELPIPLSKSILSSSFYIKSNSSSAVLCTSSNTYELIKVHCSNTVLIKHDNKIKCNLGDYYEVIEKPHGLIRIEVYQLIRRESGLYKCDDVVMKESGEKVREYKEFGIEELDMVVMGSVNEIKNALVKLRAIRDGNGKYKLLDFRVEKEIMNNICLVIIEKNMMNNGMNIEQNIGTIMNRLIDFENYDELSIKCCLSYFLTIDQNNNKVFNLDNILLFQARILFSNTELMIIDSDHEKIVLDFHLFFSLWKSNIEPFYSNVKKTDKELLQLLNGHFVKLNDNHIVELDVNELPINIKERFNKLFHIKKRWKFEEITGYIKDYSTSKLRVQKILSKCCKLTSGFKGKKYYIKKI